MNLVIVESPAKAKTINKYLGSDYKVLASYGHIRDLPSKNGSVDTENKFKMIWEIDSFSKKYLKEITDTAKESKKIIIHVRPKTKPYIKFTLKRIPTYVATPFPPLNFNQIGKTCPKKTIKAERCKYSEKNCCVITTGTYPLRISNIRVVAAKYLLPVLRTFVAPILPEPIFLISWSPKNLVKINPKGIEPLKYEKKITNIISITY